MTKGNPGDFVLPSSTDRYQCTLAQGLEALEQLSDATYRQAPIPKAGSIGAHYRHIIDHFHALKNGWARGQVDYEQRLRGTPVEQDRRFAVELLTGIDNWLRSLPAAQLEQPLRVLCDIGGGPSASRSTLARELAFVCSHAIHHYAVIALLAERLGQPLPADFGVAPGTLRYRQGASSVSCVP